MHHLFFYPIPRQPRSTLFPYTTLFRSKHPLARAVRADKMTLAALEATVRQRLQIGRAPSELQSPMYLVCRLLLEKKKDSLLSVYLAFRKQRRINDLRNQNQAVDALPLE